LPEVVAWAKLNDGACRGVSRRAMLIIHDILFHEDAAVDDALITRRIWELYSSQFGSDIARLDLSHGGESQDNTCGPKLS
jgi:hypothetical protein